jgi:hypothetical protein
MTHNHQLKNRPHIWAGGPCPVWRRWRQRTDCDLPPSAITAEQRPHRQAVGPCAALFGVACFSSARHQTRASCILGKCSTIEPHPQALGDSFLDVTSKTHVTKECDRFHQNLTICLFVYGTKVWTQGLHPEPLHQTFLVKFFLSS